MELTIGIPNYNHAHYLPFTLDSILQQSFQSYEIIIVNDGSTDDSLKVIKEYMKRDSRIKLIEHSKNQGIFVSIQDYIKMAKGKYIFDIAADDIIMPGFLERCYNLIEKFPQAGLCSTEMHIIDKHGKIINTTFSGHKLNRKECYVPPQKIKKYIEKYGNYLQGTATFYRSEIWTEYIDIMQILGDGITVAAIAAKHGACYIPEPLACFRYLPGSYCHSFESDVDQTIDKLTHKVQLLRTKRFNGILSNKFINKSKEIAMKQLCSKVFQKHMETVEDYCTKMKRISSFSGKKHYKVFGEIYVLVFKCFFFLFKVVNKFT